MNYFPMFMDIRNRKILICGGGKHALEKAGRLEPFGAQIHVISEKISAEMEELGRRFCGRTEDGMPPGTEGFGKISCVGEGISPGRESHGKEACGGTGERARTDRGKIVIERHRFSEKDLTPPPVFVIAAEEREENERIAGLCRKVNIPVNAVDMQDICDFIFPAMVTTGEMCIGISTGGLSPAAAVELKQRVTETVPDNIDEILQWMVRVRDEVRRRVPKEEQRLILREIVRRAFAADRPLTEEEMSFSVSRPLTVEEIFKVTM